MKTAESPELETLHSGEGAAGAAEQQHYAQHLIAAGQRLQQRAEPTPGIVIDADIAADRPIALPANTVELDWKP